MTMAICFGCGESRFGSIRVRINFGATSVCAIIG